MPAAVSVIMSRGSIYLGFVAVLAIGLAATWTIVARRELRAAIAREAIADVERGRATFELARHRRQDSLRAECRLLAADPRVKSTLATERMDEATVADILGDLMRLRGRGFFAVLSRQGRVFAEAGADELRGLDLATSSVIQAASGAQDAVLGSWTIGRQLIDVGISAVRLDGPTLAYLVVGEAIDRAALQAFADAADLAAAIAFGETVAAASSDDAALAALAREPASDNAHVVELGGVDYAVRIAELERDAPARPRLVIARALDPAAEQFATLARLLWVPPALVVVALLLGAVRWRRAS